MKNYEKLKQVIKEANPYIVCVECYCGAKVPANQTGYHTCGSFLGGLYKNEREIRLADVLYVLNKHSKIPTPIMRGNILCIGLEHEAKWNFLDDNLDHQSEKTKEFLISILVK